MLISSILNFQTARFDSGNDLPYILFLPDLHRDGLVSPQAPAPICRTARSQNAVAEAEQFALGAVRRAR